MLFALAWQLVGKSVGLVGKPVVLVGKSVELVGKSVELRCCCGCLAAGTVLTADLHVAIRAGSGHGAFMCHKVNLQCPFKSP